MAKTIVQKVVFKNTTPKALYNLYMNAKLHSEQTWRGQDWDKKDTDSIFMIRLEPKGKDVVLHAVHSNIPDEEEDGINKGWHEFYWNPWKQHLTGKPITRAKM